MEKPKEPHIVIEGDTLWDIAKDEYGNGQYWTEIMKYKKNKNKIRHPKKLQIGTILDLPDLGLKPVKTQKKKPPSDDEKKVEDISQDGVLLENRTDGDLYQVDPNEQAIFFRRYNPPQPTYSKPARPLEIYANLKKNKNPIPVHRRFPINFHELDPLTSKTGFKDIIGKWVFVFHDNKIKCAVYYPSPTDKEKTKSVLRYENGEEDSKDILEGSTITLDAGPKDERYWYQGFLSPVKLTKKCLNYLSKEDRLKTAAIRFQMISSKEPTIM